MMMGPNFEQTDSDFSSSLFLSFYISSSIHPSLYSYFFILVRILFEIKEQQLLCRQLTIEI